MHLLCLDLRTLGLSKVVDLGLGLRKYLNLIGILADSQLLSSSDWLIEVCEVYKLHRETFYLAVDFLDRYLGKADSVPKNRLQLIGVTCLFIGAKLEEIYPPKLAEFAYVTGM